MKKKLIVMLVAVMMLFSTSVVASAADVSIGYESSYNANDGFVYVTVYVDNAIGVQAADLNLGFDEAMYSFDDYETTEISDGMIIASYIERIPGLATCSVIFTEKCIESDLNENGRLELVTFTFKPVDDNYDINEFYLWTSCLQLNDKDIYQQVAGVGNDTLQEDKTELVTSPPTNASADKETTKKGTAGVSGNLSSKWYVYVIAGVLAIGAIAGIAMVAIKSNHNEDEKPQEEESKPEADSDKE